MMNQRIGICLLTAVCLLMQIENGKANNMDVSSPVLRNQNEGEKYAFVQFDLSWDNSWRNGVNRDAAWVFVKFKPDGSNAWEHATLSTNKSDHIVSGGARDVGLTGTNGVGVFIYRSGNGTGNVSYSKTKLCWNYGADGYEFQKGDKINISVHAIEMVYIPEGAFYLGTGGTEEGHFYEYTDGSQTTNTFIVASEDPIAIGTNNGSLWGIDATIGPEGTLSNAYPKGYAAFYCMKYEISQGQYAAFLNKLTAPQDGTRYFDYNNQYRYTITSPTTNHSASVPDRACNYISWMDGCAFADWAGLRPMTELEFEKACRGTEVPVANEFAWGSASLNSLDYTITDDGQPNATVDFPTEGAGNALNAGNYNNMDPSGPLRCGIFAASKSNPTRAEAGGSYYGVMEMSGNLEERAVSAGNAKGRVFTGSHGDGVLTSSGYADNSDWPGYSGGVVNGAEGGGWRGGRWDTSEANLHVSDRDHAADIFTSRSYNVGWRGVRTCAE